MRKILAVIGFILLFTIKQQVVYAGTLNEYETEVIRAARGQFESRGITYQVDSVYVDELIRYLMQDDIDITAEQRDKAISIMFDNVEQGVEVGYLIPVEGKNSTEADIDIEESEILEETGDFADSQYTNKIEEELNGAEVSTNNITGDRADELIDQIINGSEKTTKVDTDRGKIIVTSGDNNNLITVNTVIKNTGFNLNATLFMVTILVIIMLLCIVAAIQLRLFVHEEEKYKYEK